LALGEAAPAFELPDTAGHGWSLLDSDATATVVVFTCNHCPYAIGGTTGFSMSIKWK
jgi:peroxiredoxin